MHYKTKRFLFIVTLIFSGISWASVEEDFESLVVELSFAAEPDLESFVRQHPLILTEKNSLGETALHLAAILAEPHATQYFISRGLDVNSRDRLGTTPLTAVLRELSMYRASERDRRTWEDFATTVNILIRNGAAVSNEDARLLLRYYFPRYEPERVHEREPLDEDDDDLGPRVKRRRLSETALG